MLSFDLVGLISTVALILPIIVLLWFKLAWYKSFPALLAYYIILTSFNALLLGYFTADKDIQRYHSIANDLLEAPLILYFLSYFCATTTIRKRLYVLIGALIAFEVIVLVVLGFSSRASRIVSAPGLALALAFSLYYFIRRVKITVIHHKGIGKALIAASLFFFLMGTAYVYAVYSFMNTPDKKDAHLVFFLISIISSISMSAGLYFENQRVRHLAELRTTREELKALYGEKGKKTTPFGAVALNFDKEKWS